jgi:hypothetical protein
MRLAFAAVVTLAACGNEVMPSDVRDRVSSDLANVLHQIQAMPMPGGSLLGFLAVTPIAMDPDATVKFLDERVFTDSNFLGGGLYRLPPELACTAGDSACVAQIAQAEARIRVADDDGMQFSVTLHSDELSVTLDLDNADAAMIAFARALGETAPDAVTAGQLTADIKIGDAGPKITLSIDRALGFAVADQGASAPAPIDGDAAIRFAVESGQIAIDHDGMDVTLGAITAHLPGEDVAIAPITATALTKNAIDTITGSFDLRVTTTRAPAPYIATHVTLAGSLNASATDLELLVGSLSLATNPDTFGFLAFAGQCITSVAAYDSESLTDYMQYSVAACR